MQPNWRVVYFGTPTVAVAPLQALCRAGHDVALVVTRPAKRRGRRQIPTPSPVAAAAADLGLAVTSDLSDGLGVEADLGVVVAYGEHIPDEVLQRRRTVNLHFSLLPRWRGAAPVERAILAGDTETGVCLMDVASEIDAGAVYRRRSTAIRPDESADELRARLCEMGIGLLLDALREGFGDPVPQSGEMTWAAKIGASELRVDWSAPAEHVLRLVRVGGAWTTYRNRRLKILQARLAPGTGPPNTTGTGPPDAACVDRPDAACVGQPDAAGTDQSDAAGMGQPDATGTGPPDAAGTGQTDAAGVGQLDAAGTGQPDAADAGEPDAAGTVSLMPRSGQGPSVNVAAGSGAVELVTVQSEGRAAVPAREWVNGARITGGERLGE